MYHNVFTWAATRFFNFLDSIEMKTLIKRYLRGTCENVILNRKRTCSSSKRSRERENTWHWLSWEFQDEESCQKACCWQRIVDFHGNSICLHFGWWVTLLILLGYFRSLNYLFERMPKGYQLILRCVSLWSSADWVFTLLSIYVQ